MTTTRTGMTPLPPRLPASTPSGRDLVVFSHLRWTWVWQRPQHLISRFAETRQAKGAHTWFVEEPLFADVDEPVLRTESLEQGITRVWLDVPTPNPAPRLTDFDMPVAANYPELLAEYLGDVRCSDTVPLDVWLYTPMAYPLTRGLTFDQVIYDVMDDLSSFAYAPPGLQLSYQRLLVEADLVFTGGRSLHRSVLAHRQRNCHLFSSGVDTAHYAESMGLRRPHPKPVAGFVGVLDERLDLSLLAELAASLPDWVIRLVGPVLKIDSDQLPVAPNLEYRGQVSYGELPAVMAGFDVALMPFALNDATRSISPTKTLEYLAAGLPVVSTRVPDVVADFSDMVALAGTGAEFAAACRLAIAADVGQRDARLRRLREKHEWDVIAADMSELMDAGLGARFDRPVARGVSA